MDSGAQQPEGFRGLLETMNPRNHETTKCAFPGCDQPPERNTGPGRPPRYCPNPEHTADSARRARAQAARDAQEHLAADAEVLADADLAVSVPALVARWARLTREAAGSQAATVTALDEAAAALAAWSDVERVQQQLSDAHRRVTEANRDAQAAKDALTVTEAARDLALGRAGTLEAAAREEALGRREAVEEMGSAVAACTKAEEQARVAEGARLLAEQQADVAVEEARTERDARVAADAARAAGARAADRAAHDAAEAALARREAVWEMTTAIAQRATAVAEAEAARRETRQAQAGATRARTERDAARKQATEAAAALAEAQAERAAAGERARAALRHERAGRRRRLPRKRTAA